MKTTANLENYDFSQYDSIFQIRDCERSGHIRVLGIIGERYSFKEKTWYIYAETNYITKDSLIHLKEFTHPTRSKGEDWVISDNYSVILTNSAGVPLVNPDLQPTQEVEVLIGQNEETGENIYETQTLEKPITYENSPFKLMPAFERYSDFKRRKENPVSMYAILTVAIANDDAMGYFDEKEYHPSVLDVVKNLYEAQK